MKGKEKQGTKSKKREVRNEKQGKGTKTGEARKMK